MRDDGYRLCVCSLEKVPRKSCDLLSKVPIKVAPKPKKSLEKVYAEAKNPLTNNNLSAIIRLKRTVYNVV